MVIKDNLFYWRFSLSNPEKIDDNFYIFDKIILDKELSIVSDKMRSLIISYCVLKEKGYKDSEKILSDIYELIIENEKLKYTEFIAFWKVLDFSYSIFTKYPDNKKVLEVILNRYCDRRKKLYDKYSYSNITIQALYDSGASRKKGKAGINKIIHLVDKILKINKLKGKDIKKNKFYITPDKGQKDIYEKILEKFNIKSVLQNSNQKKVPDFLIKINKDIYIIEAKHLKEGGGEQDKSVSELIDFIKQEEDSDKIHYISFLDGIYFNLFINNQSRKTKLFRQKQDIEKALEKFKQNYFLNTKGFIRFLEDIKG